jgi:hypothetical protein
VELQLPLSRYSSTNKHEKRVSQVFPCRREASQPKVEQLSFATSLTVPAGSFLRHTKISSRKPADFYRVASGSDLKEAAPDCDGNSMRPIVGSQFVHEVLYVEVDCSLRNSQLICDLLVAIAVANESEHLQLPSR